MDLQGSIPPNNCRSHRAAWDGIGPSDIPAAEGNLKWRRRRLQVERAKALRWRAAFTQQIVSRRKL